MKITLPWPPKELSPNNRCHWGKKAKIAKKYRMDCYFLSLKEALDIGNQTEGKFHVFIDFYPPDKRRRDDDNTVASFKAGRDGLALAMRVDDSRFISHPCLRDEVRNGGEVVVSITTIDRTRCKES